MSAHDILLSCCYHPSTVVFIDDNRQYLENTSLILDSNIISKIFSEQNFAIDFLNTSTNLYNPLAASVNMEDQTSENSSVTINTHKIIDQLYNSKRFELVTVVVIDYAMPGLNGIEVCKKLTNKNLQIILLTGEADEKIAIEAFNAGIINCFIKKDVYNFTQKLNTSIHNLQRDYFENLTNIYLHALLTSGFGVAKYIKSSIVSDLFTHLYTKYSLVEHYLLDNEGSFILFDEAGKSYLLLLKTTNDMAPYIEAAKYDDNPNSKVISDLENYRRIPFLYTSTEVKLSPSEWEPHLFPAQLLKTSFGDVYYSLIDSRTNFPIKKDEIVFLDDYLANH